MTSYFAISPRIELLVLVFVRIDYKRLLGATVTFVC